MIPVRAVRLTILSGFAALGAACTTPTTTLRNAATGQVVTCGGNTASSIAGGAIGYSIQRNADDRCVENYARQGFVRAP
ncbi:hypothetical protein ACE7GA_03105 [Roseomonas sp. CCTCC AB2023176]|uniref:hypothetical protein n=1 Tax=Roseomonas sp. CCTCC AB2023176 TaxID=3342640 RepID=UPI0035D7A6B0